MPDETIRARDLDLSIFSTDFPDFWMAGILETISPVLPFHRWRNWVQQWLSDLFKDGVIPKQEITSSCFSTRARSLDSWSASFAITPCCPVEGEKMLQKKKNHVHSLCLLWPNWKTWMMQEVAQYVVKSLVSGVRVVAFKSRLHSVIRLHLAFLSLSFPICKIKIITVPWLQGCYEI